MSGTRPRLGRVPVQPPEPDLGREIFHGNTESPLSHPMQPVTSPGSMPASGGCGAWLNDGYGRKAVRHKRADIGQIKALDRPAPSVVETGRGFITVPESGK